jgi:predicted transposase YbfD/YdcC
LPKKTFAAAAKAQVRAIIQLKDNQPSLLNDAVAACAARRPVSTGVSVDKARNRHETRIVEVFRAKPAVAGTEWETLVTDIIRVNRTVLHRSAKTGLWSRASEVAYYLANFSAPAKCCAAAIRRHWHVENTLHYTRDVTFLEDQSRIRCNPGVFARLRSFGYNILRRNKVSTFSQDRYAAALRGIDALLKWSYS